MGRPYASGLRLLRVAATPPNIAEGDLWYRTDLGQVHACDDTTTIPQIKECSHPYIRPAGWHNLPPWGNATTLMQVMNQAYALPFTPGRETTLTAMAINITIVGVGNTRAGFYNADQSTGLPTTLIADFGTIGTTVMGQKTWTPTPIPLKPLLYYAVVVQQGAVATYSARTSWDPIVSETTPVFGQERNAYNQTGIVGALPASFGVPSGSSTGPSVFLQLT